MDLYDKLKKYFDETPKEQVLKDWGETEIYDNVNSPTVEQFLLHSVVVPKGTLCDKKKRSYKRYTNTYIGRKVGKSDM